MAADLEGALAEAAFTETASVVGSTAVASAEVVCAAEELAPEDSATSPAVGDLTTEDLATEDSGAGSAAASEIMDFMVVIPIRMSAIPISTITTGAIIRARARQLPSAFGCAAPMSAMFGSISLHVAMLAGAALGAAALVS